MRRADRSSVAAQNRTVAELQGAGRTEEAFALAAETVQLAEANLPETEVERAKAIFNLAGLQEATGDTSGALGTFERALEAMRIAVGERHQFYARTLSSLGSLLRELDRYEEAEPKLVRAAMILAHDDDPDHFRLVKTELAVLHASIARRDLADILDRQDQSATEIGMAHFERSMYATAMRWELERLRSEVRGFAEQNLDSARETFGAMSTHSRALAIVQARRDHGEPFVLLLRGFEGESYDYVIDNPSYLTNVPGSRTVANVWTRPGEVERVVSEAISGRLATLTAASPSSPDSAQSSQGARLPRLILGDDWLDTVRTLIKLAHLIVVDCYGLNPGLRKELAAIEQCGKCDNTVILLHRDRSELDQTEGFARAMADIAGGTLFTSPLREWMTKAHPSLMPFEKIGYIEDLVGTDIADSALFGDLFSSRHFIRSAIRLAQKGVELAESGSVPEAADYLQVALVMAEGIPGWEERSTTWFNLGVIAHAIDRHEDAITAFRQAHAAAVAMQNLIDQGRSLSMLGEESMRAGRLTDAVASLVASLTPLDAVQETTYLTRSLRLLAEACRAAGEPERAAAAQAELQRLEDHGQWSQDGAGLLFKTLFLT